MRLEIDLFMDFLQKSRTPRVYFTQKTGIGDVLEHN